MLQDAAPLWILRSGGRAPLPAAKSVRGGGAKVWNRPAPRAPTNSRATSGLHQPRRGMITNNSTVGAQSVTCTDAFGRFLGIRYSSQTQGKGEFTMERRRTRRHARPAGRWSGSNSWPRRVNSHFLAFGPRLGRAGVRRLGRGTRPSGSGGVHGNTTPSAKRGR